MSFHIEYVTSVSAPSQVCHSLISDADEFDDAEEEAYARSEVPRVLMGAKGYRIRKVGSGDTVAVIAFDA